MNGTEDAVPTAKLEEGITTIKARIAREESERDALNKRIAADREEEKLLGRLLALRRGEPAVPTTVGPLAVQPENVDHDKSDGGLNNSLVTTVIEELSSAGRPIHISELMRILHARKVQLPGAGTQANVIVHLRRDP